MSFYFSFHSNHNLPVNVYRYNLKNFFLSPLFYKSFQHFKFYFYPKLRCLTLKLEIITWYGLNHLLWAILKDVLTLTKAKHGIFYNLKNWHFRLAQKESRTLVTQRSPHVNGRAKRRYQQRRVFWTLEWNIQTANPFWVEKQRFELFLKQFLVEQRFKHLFTLHYTFNYK